MFSSDVGRGLGLAGMPRASPRRALAPEPAQARGQARGPGLPLPPESPLGAFRHRRFLGFLREMRY